MGNIVAIVGRPNVGKSTLYNRLIGERKAIIDNTSGVTRDRQYGTSFWNGKTFNVVDTGGFVLHSNDIFEAAIRSQVEIAIEEADAIIFMVDVSTGLTDLDEQVANMLRKTPKNVFLAVNKVDNAQMHLEANEFWSLGFEETHFLSSITGSGTGELLDALCEVIENIEPDESEVPRFAIVGRPNVGKSSFVNAFTGTNQNIVTDIAGTTRDAIHTRYNKFDKEFVLIDTAGIRRKSRVKENLEFYSVMRAIRALEECDVCLLMIDATQGIEAQDLNIFRLAQNRNKGIMILVNKWDLVDKETNTARDMEAEIKERIAPFNDLPIIFISALEKQRILKSLEMAIEVAENRCRKITTSKLNEFLQEAIENYAPPTHRGKTISIKYVTQLPTYYPTFAFFCNHPKHLKESYKQYLENQLRINFGFTGVPLVLSFRQK